MASRPLTMYRCLQLTLFLWFSLDDRLICNGDAKAPSCKIFSIYWEMHSEDPLSYLAVDHIIIRDMKNRTCGLLQLYQSHTIELMHNNISSRWIFKTMHSSHSTPIDEMFNVSRVAQNSPKNYFANFLKEEHFCAGKTVQLLEDKALTLAIVASDWFPVTVNSNFATQLEVLWNPDYLLGDEPFVTLVLYEVKGVLLETVSSSGTIHTFSALIPCTEYRICLSTQDTKNPMCVAVSTDPLPPTNFTVLRTNSSGLTVYWDKPSLGKYNSICLEARAIQAIFLQQTSKKFTLTQHGKEFTIPGLSSCQKVNISAWTVCDSNAKKTSRAIFAVTVTGPSEITNVFHNRTTDGIFLFWTTLSMYHFIHVTVGEKLHGITRNNHYLVTGLPSCTQNKFTLEALCGKSSSGIVSIRDSTGPGFISALKIQMNAKGTLPVVTWKSLSGPNATYVYRLLENANNTIEVGATSTTTIQMTNLKNNTEYFFEVKENCLGELGDPAFIKFVLYNIEALYIDESPVGANRSIPAVMAWVPPNYSVDLHPMTQRSALDAVKTCVQKLISRCPLLKAVSSEISSQFSSTKICLTISFHIETQTPNVTIPMQPQNNSEGMISTWRGCFDLTEDPSSGIICGSRTDISPIQDDLPAGQDATSSKGSRLGNTQKADSKGHAVLTIPPSTADETGQLLSTQQEEQFWGSEISLFCHLEFMKLNVSKAYLHGLIQQKVKLVLNDGSCSINNTDSDYYELTVLFEFPFCGGQMLVNETHIIFQHHLQNTYDPDIIITRGDFTLIWQCVYLRDKILTVHDGAFTSISSLVKDTVQSGIKALRLSKVLLLYIITLFRDDSFSPRSAVNESVTFALSETLHIEVKAKIIDVNFNKTFHLKVVSCWATMTPDPEKGPKYYFLQNSCPVDQSFKWITPNGVTSFSRFSVQMFVFDSMKESPIYIHCSSNFCTSEKSLDCSTVCPDSEGSHPELLRDSATAVNSMISAVSITIRPNSTLIDSDGRQTSWNRFILTTLCGIVGLLTIFFFGIKIITVVLHCQQNRKTYPKEQNSW